MYCSKCGEPVHQNDQNCASCGEPVQSGGGGAHAGGQPVYSGPTGSPSPTYLVPSILVTLFCCQVCGIVAIVFSAIAMGKNSSGDYEGAQKAASTAKLWNWIGFGIGFVFVLIYAALMVVGGLASATP